MTDTTLRGLLSIYQSSRLMREVDESASEDLYNTLSDQLLLHDIKLSELFSQGKTRGLY